jgi:hypothetical protein
VDRTRLHHEVVPWYLGDVPDGEYRSCDELTQNIDWATAESQPCSRPAHVMYGELACAGNTSARSFTTCAGTSEPSRWA